MQMWGLAQLSCKLMSGNALPAKRPTSLLPPPCKRHWTIVMNPMQSESLAKPPFRTLQLKYAWSWSELRARFVQA